MYDKLSSFSPNDDRFEYKTRGFFRCKFSLFSEILLTIVVTAPTIGVFAYFMAALIRSGVYNNFFTYLSGIIYPPLVGAGVLFLWSILMKYALSGCEYRYEADGKKILIISPKQGEAPVEINYSEVITVEFEPIYLFRPLKKLLCIQRGYRVIVTTKNNKYIYNWIYNSIRRNIYFEEKMCPLYTIKERSEFFKENEHKQDESGLIDSFIFD